MGGSGILGAFEELVLLEVVAQAGDGYGVSLRRELSRKTGSDVAMGAVHATLERLEEKGLVVSGTAHADPPRPGRPRRCFRITEAGARELGHTRRVRERMWADVPSAALEGGSRDA